MVSPAAVETCWVQMMWMIAGNPGAMLRGSGKPTSLMARRICGQRRRKMPRWRCRVMGGLWCPRKPDAMRPMTLARAIFCLLLLAASANAATIFHRGGIGEPDSLDPHLTTTGYAGNIISDMFIGL